MDDTLWQCHFSLLCVSSSQYRSGSGLTGVCIAVEIMLSDCEAGLTTCLWGAGWRTGLGEEKERKELLGLCVCAAVGRAKAGGVEHTGNVGRRMKWMECAWAAYYAHKAHVSKHIICIILLQLQPPSWGFGVFFQLVWFCVGFFSQKLPVSLEITPNTQNSPFLTFSFIYGTLWSDAHVTVLFSVGSVIYSTS